MVINNKPFVILNKSVINYLPRRTYHLKYKNPALVKIEIFGRKFRKKQS